MERAFQGSTWMPNQDEGAFDASHSMRKLGCLCMCVFMYVCMHMNAWVRACQCV